jgi:glycosyltransferase involved in cell wall biosynthesis
MLNAKRNSTRLVIIGGNPGDGHGSSYVDTIKKTANSLGVSNHIIWTREYAPTSDEGSLYLRAADAGVFPFDYGVTLNRSSVAAAAAHGLPIVTTKGATVEAAFRDGENVLLCPPRDAKSLACAVKSLIVDPVLRARVRAGALELAEHYFSWDKAVDRTVEKLRS